MTTSKYFLVIHTISFVCLDVVDPPAFFRISIHSGRANRARYCEDASNEDALGNASGKHFEESSSEAALGEDALRGISRKQGASSDVTSSEDPLGEETSGDEHVRFNIRLSMTRSDFAWYQIGPNRHMTSCDIRSVGLGLMSNLTSICITPFVSPEVGVMGNFEKWPEPNSVCRYVS